MRYLLLLIPSLLLADPLDRHLAVHEWLHPGVPGISMRAGEIIEWPEGLPRPTAEDLDALEVSVRRWRRRRDKREEIQAAIREATILQTMKSEDASAVTTAELLWHRARIQRLRQELQAMPTPAVTPAPTPTPEP